MATTEELKARQAAIFAAEGAALYALAEGMRELAAELPEGSQLALHLAAEATELERRSSHVDDRVGSRMGITGIRIRVRALMRERLAAVSRERVE
jgi:hypothetical protein